MELVNNMHIHEFQEMMKRLYIERDSKRGVTGTYNWLLDELGELGEALEGKDKEATENEQNIPERHSEYTILHRVPAML